MIDLFHTVVFAWLRFPLDFLGSVVAFAFVLWALLVLRRFLWRV